MEEGEMAIRVERVFFELLPKNRDVRECTNNRTIALIPHTCKILLRTVQKWLEPYTECEMPT